MTDRSGKSVMTSRDRWRKMQLATLQNKVSVDDLGMVDES